VHVYFEYACFIFVSRLLHRVNGILCSDIARVTFYWRVPCRQRSQTKISWPGDVTSVDTRQANRHANDDTGFHSTQSTQVTQHSKRRAFASDASDESNGRKRVRNKHRFDTTAKTQGTTRLRTLFASSASLASKTTQWSRVVYVAADGDEA